MSEKATARRSSDRDNPNLLIAYLKYALADVTALSERSGRYLEQAIETLTEDTSLVDLADVVAGQRHAGSGASRDSGRPRRREHPSDCSSS